MPRVWQPKRFPRIRFIRDGSEHWFRQPPGKLFKEIKINQQVRELLDTPTWSVASLMYAPKSNGTDSTAARTSANVSTNTSTPDTAPVTSTEAEAAEITPEKLHHLLKLSALPPPKDLAEEESMLADLRAQVHFVKQIQQVDTTGVEPLVAVRDETNEAAWENTVTEHTLSQYFALEDAVGENGTLRRRRDVSLVISEEREMMSYVTKESDIMDEPFLLSAQNPERGRKMGGYFYVRKQGKAAGQGKEDQQVQEQEEFDANSKAAQVA